MQEYARIARPFFVMLAIVTAGRWLQGTVFGIEYQRGTAFFSLVTLTFMASLFSTVFARRWLGWSLWQAVGYAIFLAVVAQLVIFVSTAVSYLAGIPSYFNHPRALNQELPVAFASAMLIRLSGLVGNTILNGIAGGLGWALGALMPARPRA